MRIHSLLAVACLAALAACAPSLDTTNGRGDQATASAGQHEAEIDALFSEQVRPGSPGATVGVYQHGKLVFAKGYGLADVEAGTPITPQTRFHVASVSKQFTAFAVALLAREGKIDLDADVRTYLPYVPDFGHKITVRHLILHTSGLRDQWALFEMGGHTLDDRLAQGQIINMVSHQRGLNFEPGTQHSYCNTGYALLAEIVHAVSGQTLRQFTTERMFRPLGMDSTFFFDDVTEIVAGRANSYEFADDGEQRLQRSLLNYDNVGATSLFTTVEDMAKWAGNFTQPKVGDRALIERITTNGTLDDGTPIEYGFGLIRDQADGRTRVSHSGSDAGFRSQFVYYPDDDFAVIITANVPFNLRAKATAIADLYLPKSAAPESKPEPAPEDPNADATPLAGLYVRPEYRQHVKPLRLQFENGKLSRNYGRGEHKSAILRQDGSFDFGDPRWESFRPVRDANGRVTALDVQNFYEPAPLRYPRAEPSRLNAAGLAPYAGRYHSAELDITYDVRVNGDRLTLSSLWTPEPIALEQVVTDRFESQAWWAEAVLFQRDRGGRIRSLSLNTERAQAVILERVE